MTIEIADEGTDTENFVQIQRVLLGHHFLLHMDGALEENSSDSPPSLLLDQNLICIIYHRVHVLVETINSAPYSHVFFVDPDLHTISLLEVAEDLIDGLGHNILQLFVESHATEDAIKPDKSGS